MQVSNVNRHERCWIFLIEICYQSQVESDSNKSKLCSRLLVCDPFVFPVSGFFALCHPHQLAWALWIISSILTDTSRGSWCDFYNHTLECLHPSFTLYSCFIVMTTTRRHEYVKFAPSTLRRNFRFWPPNAEACTSFLSSWECGWLTRLGAAESEIWTSLWECQAELP